MVTDPKMFTVSPSMLIPAVPLSFCRRHPLCGIDGRFGWDQHPRSEPSHEAGTGHSLGKGWRQARPIFPGADSHRAKRAGVQDSQSPPELTPLSPKAEAHPQRWTVCQGAGKWQVKLSVLLKLPQDKEEASP